MPCWGTSDLSASSVLCLSLSLSPWEGLFRSVVRRKQAEAGCWAWGVLGPSWGVLSRTVLLLSVWKARKDTAGCCGARGGGRALVQRGIPR